MDLNSACDFCRQQFARTTLLCGNPSSILDALCRSRNSSTLHRSAGYLALAARQMPTHFLMGICNPQFSHDFDTTGQH
eukprot:4351709-Amphidinium_carterae.1